MSLKVVCVVAAHPDDEILGCGGVMAKHIAQGDSVHVLIMSEGITSRQDQRDASAANAELLHLKRCAYNANKAIGVNSVQFSHFPDNRMDSVNLLDIIKEIEHFIGSKKPQVVYTHHSSDINIDHQKVHESVLVAARSTPGCSIRTLLFFEVLSSTEWQVPGSHQYFQPNWFVDISVYFKKKIEAIRMYEGELRNWPHPRSERAIEALSLLRGSTVGVDHSEAFVLGRQIV